MVYGEHKRLDSRTEDGVWQIDTTKPPGFVSRLSLENRQFTENVAKVFRELTVFKGELTYRGFSKLTTRTAPWLDVQSENQEIREFPHHFFPFFGGGGDGAPHPWGRVSWAVRRLETLIPVGEDLHHGCCV